MSTESANAAGFFVDRHATGGTAEKAAFVEGIEGGRSLTYRALAESSGKMVDLYERHGIERDGMLGGAGHAEEMGDAADRQHQRVVRQLARGQQLGAVLVVACRHRDGLARTVDAGQLAEAERMRRLTATLPLKRPLQGEMETTSGFGYRIDPFTRSMALHTGLDFRDEYGAPVRATAPGKVVTAEWSGGYGRMVEIDHGNGITTRYGHLSKILVKEGDVVDAGDLIALSGSTGRSTGPHLHYEVRRNGNAVDPMRFLNAGLKLTSYL